VRERVEALLERVREVARARVDVSDDRVTLKGLLRARRETERLFEQFALRLGVGDPCRLRDAYQGVRRELRRRDARVGDYRLRLRRQRRALFNLWLLPLLRFVRRRRRSALLFDLRSGLAREEKVTGEARGKISAA
jgi:hypothetical protein